MSLFILLRRPLNNVNQKQNVRFNKKNKNNRKKFVRACAEEK